MKTKLLMMLPLSIIAGLWSASIDARNSNQAIDATQALQQKKWIHGSEDCQTNTDPEIEAFKFDETSFVLRQSKCATYEAPFIYVLFGSEKVLVLDTGAIEESAEFSLFGIVNSLNRELSQQTGSEERDIVVVHSHGHGDHYAGDGQFSGQANVEVVAPNQAGVLQFFGFKNWPNDVANLDLGDRKITIMPTPGHQEEAISLYDSHTKWLLTGDTLYPGAVYVKHWDEYKNSIERLASFAQENDVSLVLGAHIEMTNSPGEYYPIGSSYQPDEASLALAPQVLTDLNTQLQNSPDAQMIVMDELVVEPMGALQKTISNIARWLTQ